jgi:hypothetical protein
MSYVTLEVTIDHGRIVPKEPDKLPDTGKGLLTFAVADQPVAARRPIGLAKGQFKVPDDFNAPLPETANTLEAFKRLQEEAQMTPEKAAAWHAAILEARR